MKMNNPTRGLHIYTLSKQVFVLEWSTLTGQQPNEIILNGDLIHLEEDHLVMKIKRIEGKTNSGAPSYKSFYQIWELYSNTSASTRAIKEIDGKFVLEFPVNQPKPKSQKGRRTKLR